MKRPACPRNVTRTAPSSRLGRAEPGTGSCPRVPMVESRPPRPEFPVHQHPRARMKGVFPRAASPRAGLPGAGLSAVERDTGSSPLAPPAVSAPVMTQPSPAGANDRRCGGQPHVHELRRSDIADLRSGRIEMGLASGGEQTPEQHTSVTGRVTSGAVPGPASAEPVDDAPMSSTGMTARGRALDARDASSAAGGRASRSRRAALPARSPLAARKVIR